MTKLTLTEAAALEALAVQLHTQDVLFDDIRMRRAPLGLPMLSSLWVTLPAERRRTYREMAAAMLKDRETFDDPPPVLRTIEPWEAKVLCLLADQNPESHIDYADLRKDKRNWEYFRQDYPVDWHLKRSEVVRAAQAAHQKGYEGLSMPEAYAYPYAPEDDA